jgi:hypothetical protein
VAPQLLVAVTENRRDEGAQQPPRQRQARLPGEAVDDRGAAAGGRLDRPLVLPEPLREHRRALEEAAAGLDPGEADLVVVDRDEAEEQQPAAAHRPRLEPVQVEARKATRRRHPQQRPELGVDPLGAHRPRPDGGRLRPQARADPELAAALHQPRKTS